MVATQICFIFTPNYLGEDELTHFEGPHIFQMGGEKPPTNLSTFPSLHLNSRSEIATCTGSKARLCGFLGCKFLEIFVDGGMIFLMFLPFLPQSWFSGKRRTIQKVTTIGDIPCLTFMIMGGIYVTLATPWERGGFSIWVSGVLTVFSTRCVKILGPTSTSRINFPPLWLVFSGRKMAELRSD